MEHTPETKPVENTHTVDSHKNEQKFRHNRRAPNNDLWIHVDAHNADSSKFLPVVTGLSTLGILALTTVVLVQYNQNEILMEKYDKVITQIAANNAEALADLENGLNSVSNSIDKLTIAVENGQTVITSDNATPDEVAPVVPEDDSAFMGIVVMSDGTAVTPLGLRIAGIYNNSPAANAGLRAGDIIMSIDGIPVDTFETLSGI